MAGIQQDLFSENDYRTLCSQWDSESLAQRKVTIFRENRTAEDGVQLLNAEGFSLRALSEMQQVFLIFKTIIENVKVCEAYSSMDAELQEIQRHLIELILDNRYENGTMNPDFVLWNETGKAIIDVPLWPEKRNWHWIHEGEEWYEEQTESTEMQVYKEDTFYNDIHTHKDRVFYAHKHEDGNRVIGLIGEERKPAVFKGNLHKPGMIYRVEIGEEELNNREYKDYREVLKATEELCELRAKNQ